MVRKPTPPSYEQDQRWTWQMAEDALGKDAANNRRLREATIAQYARLMEEGLWERYCPTPVQFNTQGELINGRHRLHAQVRAKCTRYWNVERGVPDGSVKLIDANVPRNAADALRNEGYGSTVVLACVTRWAWLLENGQAGSGRVKVAIPEIVEMAKAHPDLQHSTTMGVYARSGFVLLNPTPMGAAHWWIAQHNDHAEADMFLERFVHINNEKDGSPVLALMHRFKEARNAKTYVDTKVQIAMVIKAWNYDVQGDFRKKLSLYTRSGEFRLQDVLTRPRDPDEERLDEPDAG